MSAPICADCDYMVLAGRAKRTANNLFRAGARAACYCGHPGAEKSFHEVCPNSGRMPGFINYTEPGGDVPNMKTSPRWCPMRAGGF